MFVRLLMYIMVLPMVAAVSPAFGKGGSYGYCYTVPEQSFGLEWRRRYPNPTTYYSGVIVIPEGADAGPVWGEFRKFIDAKGTSRSFTMDCIKSYSTFAAAAEALSRSSRTGPMERTGWSNVTAADARAVPPPPAPPVPRKRGPVYVTLPNAAGPQAVSSQKPLPAAELLGDQARATASYERQRARDQAENERVARINAERRAARQATIAQQQAEYRATLARQEAETTRIRAEWAAQVARCQAGDKSACYSNAAPR